jgi:hypothetical protein
MDVSAGHPVSVLYGLSILDFVNQVAFAVLRDANDRPDRYGAGGEWFTGMDAEVRSDRSVVSDLDERTVIYERVSGASGEALPPLAVAEFSWRAAAMAMATCEPGSARQVATAVHARTADSFRAHLDSIRDETAEAVQTLVATFEASVRILGSSQVAEAFGVTPLRDGWVLDDDVDARSADILAALTDELEPEPFGRLSAYEVQVLKRLSVERRRAIQLLVDGQLDVDKDPGPVVGWSQALDDFQLASVARAIRGQSTLDPDDPSRRLNDRDIGFLPPKVVDFISACASGGT